jgi:trimeric autotransporter adhesin
LPPSALALGPALYQEVTNPFSGISAAGQLSQSATIQLRQLLRPFPQFGNVYEHQTTGARLRYHAVTTMLERRVAGGWGGRFHYTWSRRDDDQFGDGSWYAFRAGNLPQNSADLGAEYSRSLQDVPHRVILAPIVELPFGEGKRSATHGLAKGVLGGWTIAAVASYESGSPQAIVQQSDNSGSFSGLQRPDVTGVDPRTSGSTLDRLDHYINPAAYAFAAPFTFGNAPRTDPRIRSPFRTTYDVSFAKDTGAFGPLKGQIRLEVLNLTNSPTFTRGGNGVLGSQAFGRITTQADFPRLLQVTFRALW